MALDWEFPLSDYIEQTLLNTPPNAPGHAHSTIAKRESKKKPIDIHTHQHIHMYIHMYGVCVRKSDMFV